MRRNKNKYRNNFYKIQSSKLNPNQENTNDKLNENLHQDNNESVLYTPRKINEKTIIYTQE